MCPLGVLRLLSDYGIYLIRRVSRPSQQSLAPSHEPHDDTYACMINGRVLAAAL